MIPLDLHSRGSCQVFDHVLLDVNQYLHVVCRKASTEDIALRFFLKALDDMMRLAQPRKSLVLALDGPPSAAKLATQRKRRFHVVASHVWRQKQEAFFRERGIPLFFEEKGLQQDRRRKGGRIDGNMAALCLTPGTEFMDKVHELLLFWAWQRLQQFHGPLKGVAIYQSPSLVPGEGEVKLLDWLYQASSGSWSSSIGAEKNDLVVQEGDSVAILGGDSDLVLESLLVRQTHNVVVILPEVSSRAYAVSLWEMTRQLSLSLSCHNHKINVMRLRTDLVLLLLLNGNDYLPKLTGSTRLDPLFGTYMGVVREWCSRRRDGGGDKESEAATEEEEEEEPYLLHANRLEFNLPFCLAFFGKLQKKWDSSTRVQESSSASGAMTTVTYLQSLVDGGFLPKPLDFEFSLVWVDEDKDDQDKKDDDDDDTLTDEEKKKRLGRVRLTLGKEGGDLPFYEYFMTFRRKMPRKEVRLKVADLALRGILGSDYRSFRARVLEDILSSSTKEEDVEEDSDDDEVQGNEDNEEVQVKEEEDDDDNDEAEDDDDEEEEDEVQEDEEDEDEEDVEEDDDEDDEENEEEADKDETPMEDLPSIGYDWEVGAAAPHDVESYLGGLLWNLQMYQEGVCPNYGYNYGRRQAPSAEALCDYFASKQENKRGVDMDALFHNVAYVPPLNAGESCLAALPSQVRHYIPPPYQSLAANGQVESIYASCMDPKVNTFDLDLFRKRCHQGLRQLPRSLSEDDDKDDEEEKDASTPTPPLKGSRPLRKIRVDDSHWTVLRRTSTPLQHAFGPPQVNITGLAALRPSRYIQAQLVPASIHPAHYESRRRRSTSGGSNNKEPWMNRLPQNVGDLLNVDYFQAFERERRAHVAYMERKKQTKKKKKKKTTTIETREEPRTARQMTQAEEEEEVVRLRQFGIEPPPLVEVTNVNGQEAMQVLNQWMDARLLGAASSLEWEFEWPSPSEFASFCPDAYEQVRLVLRRQQNGNDDDDNGGGRRCVWQQDRPMQRVPRRRLQHHLASLVLQEELDNVTATTTTSSSNNSRRWNEMTLAESKEYLVKHQKKQKEEEEESAVNGDYKTQKDMVMTTTTILRNLDGDTALSVLQQLDDAKVLRVTWEVETPKGGDDDDDGKERVSLRLDDNNGDMLGSTHQTVVWQQDRHGDERRKRLQQHLAQVALQSLLCCSKDQEEEEEYCGYRQWHSMTSKKLLRFVSMLFQRGQSLQFVQRGTQESNANNNKTTTTRDQVLERNLLAGPHVNVEGWNAMEILQRLVEVGVLGAMAFDVRDANQQEVRLLLTDKNEPGPSIIYTHQRNTTTRQRLQQELSMWALQDVVPTWKEQGVAEIQKAFAATTNIGDGDSKQRTVSRIKGANNNGTVAENGRMRT